MLCLLPNATAEAFTGLDANFFKTGRADFHLTLQTSIAVERDMALNSLVLQIGVGALSASGKDHSLITIDAAVKGKELGLARALVLLPKSEGVLGAGDHGFFESARDQGLGFCGLSLGGLAEEVGQSNGRKDANDGHNDHQLNEGETLLESVFGGFASAGGHEPLHQACFEDGGHEVTRPGRGCSTRPMSDGALLWGNRSGGLKAVFQWNH